MPRYKVGDVARVIKNPDRRFLILGILEGMYRHEIEGNHSRASATCSFDMMEHDTELDVEYMRDKHFKEDMGSLLDA